jgi:hypothetical protein
MDENAVVSAVCAYLEDRAWSVVQRRHTSETGIDIVATHPATGRTCYVEAKGGASATPGTKRYGKPFDGNQVAVHVGQAILAALKLRTAHPDAATHLVVIAVPDERHHRRHLDAVGPALRTVAVGTLFVSADGSVTAG